jgi:Carboxypeptidase regulatory-like domain
MRPKMIAGLLAGVVLGLCVLLSLNVNVAQADNLYGSIRGTITDQSGAGVPGVTITATNTATGVTQQLTSGNDGSYNFLQLAIGDYSLRAEKSGFEAFTATRIHLDVNTVYVQDVRLAVGTVSQEVTVQANQVQVETTTPQLGTVVEAEQIVDLPLIGRNWLQLQELQPGVMGGSDRFGVGASNRTDFATNGGQSQFNVFMIDGTDTNDLVLNTQTFTPNEDAVAEFRMVTSTLNPEYARSSGAIVNAVIKSGTNSFHGDGFDYYRDTFLDSRNYFSTTVNPFHQNQFGGTVGGPIIKNHTFFFFSYQGIRASQPQGSNGVNNGTLTTPVFLSGQDSGTTPFADLPTSTGTSAFPLVGDNGTSYPAGTPYSTIFSTGIIPTADINPISAKLLKFVPAPNTSTATGGPLNAFTFNATQALTDNQYLYRIDQVFNSKDSIWGTWFNEALDSKVPVPFFGATLPGFGEADDETFKFLSLSWTHVFNDHVVNELRGGYNRFNYAAVFPQNPMQPSSFGFGITPQDSAGAQLPVIQVTGLFNLGFSQDGPQPRIDQVYQGTDNLSIIEGRHTLKFGFDMRRWETFNPFLSNNNGFYNFQPFGAYSTGDTGADFLLGVPALYIQSSGSLEDVRTRQYYFYAQDQFKLRPNLTLTYGLGWQVDTPPINQAFGGHGQVTFRPGVQSVVFPGAPIGVVYSGDPGVNAAGRTQWTNLGPRLGLAYSPNWGWLSGGPDKMSIRAGFGIYYDRSELEQADQVVGMPPFAITTNNGLLGPGVPLSGVNPSFANPFVDVATGATVANPFPFKGFPSNVNFFTTPGLLPIYTFCCAGLAGDTRDPRVSNYNLTVQRQLTGSTIFTIGYVGSVSRYMTYGLPQNIVTGLGPGDVPINNYSVPIYGPIDTLFSGANGSYNALEASVDKRMSHNLQFLVSYTYSHSIDDASGFENSAFGTFGGMSGGLGGAIRASNPYCFPRCDFATSNFSAPQRLVISYVYQIPGLGGSWMLSKLTRGWTVSGITTFQSGFPLDVDDFSAPSGGCNLGGDFSCWDGPNQVAPVQYMNPRKTGYWFNPASFAQVACAPDCAAAGVSPTTVAAYGDAPRNPLRGPGLNNWDFVLFKDTAITERTKIQLRLEAYNVFNHTQFDPNGVNGNVSTGPSVFGTITAAQNPRLMQIAAKFFF